MTERIPQGRLPDGETALYRFYAADGELLYVGITQDLETRWNSHERDKVWWIDVDRKEYVILKTRAEADELERKAIRTEHPRYDRTRPGHLTPFGDVIYQKPLRDPHQEGIVARAEQAIGADLNSDRIPAWSLLPTVAVLAKQYETSKAAIDHALWRLTTNGVLVPVRSQYLNAPAEGFPRVAADRSGPHYVLAAHHFGLQPFAAADLAPYVPHGNATVTQRLSRLCKQGLARCLARKPAGRYVLTKLPDPDPPQVLRHWRPEDVLAIAEWLVKQLDSDAEAAPDRDREIIAACLPGKYSGVSHGGLRVLKVMARRYKDRPGCRPEWGIAEGAES